MFLDVSISDSEWMEQAACRDSDPEIFFSDNPTQAKAICAECPVAAQCRQLGQAESSGVFGGATSRERAKERRQLSRATDEARQERKLEVLRLYLEGHSFAAIAGLLEMAPTRVKEIVDTDPTTGPMARKAQAEREAAIEAKADEIRQLMDEGQSAYAIIKATGYNKATVYRLFAKAGRATAA